MSGSRVEVEESLHASHERLVEAHSAALLGVALERKNFNEWQIV